MKELFKHLMSTIKIEGTGKLSATVAMQITGTKMFVREYRFEQAIPEKYAKFINLKDLQKNQTYDLIRVIIEQSLEDYFTYKDVDRLAEPDSVFIKPISKVETAGTSALYKKDLKNLMELYLTKSFDQINDKPMYLDDLYDELEYTESERITIF